MATPDCILCAQINRITAEQPVYVFAIDPALSVDDARTIMDAYKKLGFGCERRGDRLAMTPPYVFPHPSHLPLNLAACRELIREKKVWQPTLKPAKTPSAAPPDRTSG